MWNWSPGIVPIGVATLIPLAAARAQVGDWALMRVPPARGGPAVFDGARGRLVLFPAAYSSQINEAFEWQGGWQQHSSAHQPPRRDGHAMAYDAARQRVVLFGGWSTFTGLLFADTWLWDGFDWTLTPTAVGPSARWMAAMTFDDVRSRVVLFGGADVNAALADTWQWDGAVWTQAVTGAQPSARSGAAMAFDRARGVAVLFGGNTGGGTPLSDTWTWDGARWTAMATPTPPGSGALAMANDDARGQIVLQGRF